MRLTEVSKFFKVKEARNDCPLPLKITQTYEDFVMEIVEREMHIICHDKQC